MEMNGCPRGACGETTRCGMSDCDFGLKQYDPDSDGPVYRGPKMPSYRMTLYLATLDEAGIEGWLQQIHDSNIEHDFGEEEIKAAIGELIKTIDGIKELAAHDVSFRDKLARSAFDFGYISPIN